MLPCAHVGGVGGSGLILFILTLAFLPLLITPQQPQGRGSIVPGGFQPFPSLPQNFYTSSRNAPTATSVQNSQLSFFPPSANARNDKSHFVSPTFIQFPPKAAPQRETPHYEYYDEPEEEVIYQYEDNPQPRPSNLPPQSFTTAQQSSRAKRPPPQQTRPSSTHKFIPLVEEPEQQLLLLHGRSVHPPRSSNNIRPPLGLLRSTTTPSITTRNSSTARSRPITTKRTLPMQPPPQLLRGNRFAVSPKSSPSTPSSSSSTTPTGSKKDKYKASSSETSEDYTIEYIEYPGEEYSVSEEKNQTTPPKQLTSSSTSVSSSSSTSTATATPPKEAKVVVSVSSSTKTMSGGPSTSHIVRPTAVSKTSTTLMPTSSTQRPPHRDSVVSGAETSPEYYEEEYSYQDSQQGKGKVEELTHPQARKLPSHKDNAHAHFETLVDFGELESDQGGIHVVKGNEQQEQEEYQPPSPSHPSTTTTTAATPTTEKISPVFGKIKFAEVSLDLLPPGFTFPRPTTITSTSATTPSTTTTQNPGPTAMLTEAAINFDDVPSFLLPKGYKSLSTTTTPSTTTTTTTTSSSSTTKSPIDFDSIPLSLLPKGYKQSTFTKKKEEEEETTGKNALEALLGKVKFTETVSSLLPESLLPPGYKPPSLVETAAIPPNLLPTGGDVITPPSSSSTTKRPSGGGPGPVFPTRPPGSGGLVFPTKPGGHRVTRPTSTEAPKADTPPPPRVAIAGGWPIRKTTEFTGWPTQSTTPMPSTSPTPPTTSSTTERMTTTTTPRSTTTPPPPPKRSALGVCPQEVCRMEATLRITGGVKWKPEFADINTEEYKHLEVTVRRELDGAYRASGLAPWYKRVQIEGFNEGSVLVDYFVELEGVDRELSTADVVKVFHKSLLDSDPGDELPQETDAPIALRFGRYNIDPRYTDFKVVKGSGNGKSGGAPEGIIPHWAIAVIVIVLVSFLFLIIVAVIVVVSRLKKSKKKNTVSLTQEMLNEFNKSHMGGMGPVGGGGGMDNFGVADDLYNMDDVWNDKQLDRTFDRRPPKGSQGSSSKKGVGGPGPGYNIYDSWKTEWNGYYGGQKGGQGGGYYEGESGYTPSRRRSDYDTNF